MKSEEKNKNRGKNGILLELQSAFLQYKNLGISAIIFIKGDFTEKEKDLINELIVAVTPKFIELDILELETIENSIDLLKYLWASIPKKGMAKIIYFKCSQNKMEELNFYKMLKFTENMLKSPEYTLLKISLSSKECTKKSVQDYPVIPLNRNDLYEYFIEELSLQSHKIHESYDKPTDNDVEEKNFNNHYLENVKLNKKISKNQYDMEFSHLEDRLKKSLIKIMEQGKSLIIIYEGWDASGKGGNIKRLARQLDPTRYKTISIVAPTKEERQYHYLWRFIKDLPNNGHIRIFDRSWYGRVLVERVENFCDKYQWEKSYDEINELENLLTELNTIVIKIFLHIDKEEQLRRFKSREENPNKRWKITKEDWRNREKWDQYKDAINECIAKTNTKNANWTIIEANDKKYARIKALEAIINTINKKV